MVPVAWRILLHDKVRLAITLAGITFSVVLVLVEVGIYLRILTNSSLLIDTSDADVWVTARDCRNFDFSLPFDETKAEAVRSCPEVARVEKLIMTWGLAKLPTGGSEQVQVIGFDFWKGSGALTDLASGSVLDLKTPRGVILDESSRRRLGPFEVGDYMEVTGRRVKVVGVSRGVRSLTTSPMLFTSYATAQEIPSPVLPGQTVFVLAWFRPGVDHERALATLRRIPDVDVHTRWAFSLKTRLYWTFETGMGLGFLMVTFMGLAIGMVMVGQTLYSSTLQHQREFATLKAIGAENRMIYGILVKQALSVALAGYAVGLAATHGVARFYGEATDIWVVLPLPIQASMLVLTVLMCLAASLISIRKVMVLDPMMVFRA